AVWGNRLAMERAQITRATAAPSGGQILKDATGAPTGILLNSATDLLARALPPRTDAQLEQNISAALQTMAQAGYTSVHEAGIDAHGLAVFQSMAQKHL